MNLIWTADTITLSIMAALILILAASPLYLDAALSTPKPLDQDESIHPQMTSLTHGTNPEAPVTLVEFGDYQCPYTADQQQAISKILFEFGDKINYVHMDLPSEAHPDSMAAAVAARCIGRDLPEKLQEFENLLYSNQVALSRSDLIRYAKGLSMAEERFTSCLNEASIKAAIQQDINTAVKEGVSATPTIFINGKPFRGTQQHAKLKLIIESILEIQNTRPGTEQSQR